MALSLSGCGSPKTETATLEDTAEDEVAEESGMGMQSSSPEEALDKSAEKKDTIKESEAMPDADIDEELDKAVGDAVFSHNESMYEKGECSAQGHIVMDAYEEKSSVTVYTLTMYGEYGFRNDMFIKISGSGVIPAVMTFSIGKDGAYTLQSYNEPMDGSGYTQSVKELFPKELYNRVISISENDRIDLQTQERKYAKTYLDSIGRAARIGDYSDLEMELPDISDETYDSIFDRYWEYPYWIGTLEKVENGVRYVYETQWKNYGNNDSLIYLTKYVYDTGEIIRTVNVHIDDGEVQSSEEKVLKIVENSDK